MVYNYLLNWLQLADTIWKWCMKVSYRQGGLTEMWRPELMRSSDQFAHGGKLGKGIVYFDK